MVLDMELQHFLQMPLHAMFLPPLFRFSLFRVRFSLDE
jgi:hypothetical protein